MMTGKKDLLTLNEFSAADIRAIIARAGKFKRSRLTDERRIFADKTAVLIFEKPSLRTRITFETAVHELGGHAITLTSDMVGLGKRESPEDVARNLERWVHLHHCAHLQPGDRRTPRPIQFHTGHQRAYRRLSSLPGAGLRHDPRRKLAVCSERKRSFSWATATTSAIRSSCCAPNSDTILPLHARTVMNRRPRCGAVQVRSRRKAGPTFRIMHDPRAAVNGATAVYTDVWTSMGQEKEAEKRKRDFAAFQVNRQLLSLAPRRSGCLPLPARAPRRGDHQRRARFETFGSF